ncbi:hypothetical protein K4K54_001204 [Colletotrichum sp. SAR 10_86]|nr:hypothetical protein K4K51_013240 [Colletotrichum sp. SAR 10_75]KAI8229863.1 hypothetical protein K4K54_001204 [Colletotrichum sp. SAR 10_86]KAI8250886.1 hypothetical protein K4K53_012402 [Colletotrichum sp. SAR 10_77]
MDGTSAEMAASENSVADRLTEGFRTHARMVTSYNAQLRVAGTRGPQRAARPSGRSGPASRPSLAKRTIKSSTTSQVSSKFSSSGVPVSLGSFASDDEGEQPVMPTRSSATTTAAYIPASSTPAPPKTPAGSVRMSRFADDDDDAPVSVASSDSRGSKPPPRTSKIDRSDISGLVCADSLRRAKGWTRGVATEMNAAVQERPVSSNMANFADEIKKAGASAEDDLGYSDPDDAKMDSNLVGV